MASINETMERFAHDVCVHVLEKFGIFKAPDDSRKQNNYVRHDFLPRISRSVVSFAIWIRTYFKNVLEDRCKISDLGDNEVIWIFEDFLCKSDKFSGLHWAEKVCLSLALCTEYVQFASTKDFRVSLNKIVTAWGEYFEKHLRKHFEENDEFLGLYNYIEISQINELDRFQEAFISDYCLPYGAIEYTPELSKECMEKRGLNISLESTIFGIKTLGDLRRGVSEKMKMKLKNFEESEEPKLKETCFSSSDSEEYTSGSSIDSVVEASPNIDSEASDSDIPPNNLLGIPPHEDTLREIDPFFVENIPLPPKARSSSKSPELKSGSNEAPRSYSKSTENVTVSNEGSEASSKSSEGESEENDATKSTSKSPKRESEESVVTKSSPKTPERESDDSFVTKSSPKTPESESDDSVVTKSSPKPPECEFDASNVTKSSSKSPKRESGEGVVIKTSSNSPERESDASVVTKYSPKAHERESNTSDVTKSSKSPECASYTRETIEFSKLPKRESSESDAHKPLLKTSISESGARDISKSPERESDASHAPTCYLKSSVLESDSNNAPNLSSKSPMRESVASDVQSLSSPKSSKLKSEQREIPRPWSKSRKCETSPNDAKSRSSPKSTERKSDPRESLRPSSKSPERKSDLSKIPLPSSISCVSGLRDAHQSTSNPPESYSGHSAAQQTNSKSPQSESVQSNACAQSSPETEELKERVDHILTRLECDMDELRALLYEHGLLATKYGRRGSIRLRVKDSKDKPPPGPEGLI